MFVISDKGQIFKFENTLSESPLVNNGIKCQTNQQINGFVFSFLAGFCSNSHTLWNKFSFETKFLSGMNKKSENEINPL